MVSSPKNPVFANRSKRDIWLLRGVAMVISILLCLTVLGGKRIEVVKRVLLDYQIKKGLIIANQAPTEVTVRVLGPRAFMKEFQEQSTTLSVDLQKVGVGEYEVPIREEMLSIPMGLKVISISQSTVSVRLDQLVSKRVPIRAVFGNQLPQDFKVRTITFKPSTVEITGSKQRLALIDVVPTEPINLAPENLRQEVDVKLYSGDMPGVTIKESDRVVQAVVELEGELARRWFTKIPIGIKLEASVASKFLDSDKLGIRTKPQFVSFLLEGNPHKIEAMKDSDIEAWVEIPQLKSGAYKGRLVWRLAPDLRVVKRYTDWVDVTVPPM